MEETNQEKKLPEVEALKEELERLRKKQKTGYRLRLIIGILVVVAAAAVLVSTLWVPVLQINGSSMEPTLNKGEFVLAVKSDDYKTGDLIAFYYNNKILVKRVIATEGQWVDMSEDGQVYVNSMKLDEPYLTETAYGDCDITLPYQVPEGRVFVMGDHRSVSLDSRNTAIGSIAEEQVVGKLFFRIWPLTELGSVS